jgi:hypothetical protein
MKLNRYISLFILSLFVGGIFSQFVAVKTNNVGTLQVSSQKNSLNNNSTEKAEFFDLSKYYDSLLATDNKQGNSSNTSIKPALNFLSEKFIRTAYSINVLTAEKDLGPDSYSTEVQLPYSVACKYYVFALRKIII